MRKKTNLRQEATAEADYAESVERPGMADNLGFTHLHRLLRHLRRGGSRKGACGWAELSWTDLQAALENNPRLAAALEQAESLALACDENRLDQHVQAGDRTALLFRLRRIYGFGDGLREGEEAQATGELYSREFTEAAEAIRSLGEEDRRELAGAYREAAGA